MSRRTRVRCQTKGHPRGGLFVIGVACALALNLGAGGCGAPVSRVSAGPEPDRDRLPNPLAAYRRLGFIVGTADFPVVGRVLYFPGPADSVLAALVLSLPNSALRFRREPPGFLARYRVTLTLVQHGDTIARMDETQEVRVRTFRETSRAEESIIFQGFLRAMPGTYSARIEVNDEGSGRGFAVDPPLQIPAFTSGSTSVPTLVHEARPRTSRDSMPRFIARPLATLELSDSSALFYVEMMGDAGARVIVDAMIAGSNASPVWSDTLAPRDTTDAEIVSVRAQLDVAGLPPGALELRSRLAGSLEPAAAGTLVVAPLAEWVFAEYEEVLGLLRYAGTRAQLDSLEDASIAERGRRFRLFWESRDPVPATADNEFFVQYFRRVREANDRFGEIGRAGWLTDRGAVYISFGPPDEVFRHLEPEAGTGRTQVWRYSESLGFDLRLVFADETGTGSFRLTAESRQSFQEAVERLHY